jgi:hypothetical protein
MEEKKRLEAALVGQRAVIRQDLVELKEELRPALNVLSLVGQMTNRHKANPFIAFAVGLASDVFLRNLAVSGSSKVARLLVPFFAKKLSDYLHAQKRRGIFQKLGTLLTMNKSNGHGN